MTFSEFLSEMNEDELTAYAERCETSVLYIRNHLKGASRVPRPKLMAALWQNSTGKVSREEVHNHFFPIQTSAAA